MGVACTGRGKIVGEIFVPAGGGGAKRGGERLAFVPTLAVARISSFFGPILPNYSETFASIPSRARIVTSLYLSSNLAIKVFLLVVQKKIPKKKKEKSEKSHAYLEQRCNRFV